VAVKAAEVTAIDPVARTVTTAEGERFAGSRLVLALGSRANFFGVAGAEEHALPLYTADDSIGLRNRILQLFEDADLEPSRIDEGALNFVIVGGGPTGVEAAGALADMIADVMPERYHDLDVGRARVYLVDHGSVVLSPFSESAHEYAAKMLRKKGVQLLFDHSVTEVASDRVRFADGSEIRTRCVVWAGGMRAARLGGLEAFELARGGRVRTEQDLSVAGFPGVYAIGDIASVEGPDGHPYPQLGSVAVQQGRAAAASILAEIDGTRTSAFRYHDKGIMAMIGRRAAVAEVGAHRHELHGAIAFSAWLGVHAWLLSTARSRVEAFMDWAWDSLSTSRAPAIIDDPDTPRIDWGTDADDGGDDGGDDGVSPAGPRP
jgi:NADH dehydrogenase